MEKSETETPFLGILIKQDDTGIWIDLYRKPTDTRSYVPFSSNHPRHSEKEHTLHPRKKDLCYSGEQHRQTKASGGIERDPMETRVPYKTKLRDRVRVYG